MIYGSVCSGIEAATQAWHPLGWKPAFFSEIEKFPRAVLEHHYPDVPLHGDFTTIEENQYGPIDLLVGGTPCQDNSIGHSAGTGRAGDGMDGARSGLSFGFAALAGKLRPEWVVWENVPNTLSARHADGFKRFLGALGEHGYFCAWRLLDQKWFGPADQPRPRLIVVGHRDWRCAAAVLLEPEGDCGNSAPQPQAAPVLTARGGMAYDDRTPCVLDVHGPRIATPVEWERAMGFPDDFTNIPWRKRNDAPDGPRYKALGNSMAVNVMQWIGERIALVDALTANKTE